MIGRERKEEPKEQPRTLVEYVRSQSLFNRQTPERLQQMRRYIDDTLTKGRSIRYTRQIAKGFLEKCPRHLLESLTSITLNQFRQFLQEQKRIDESRMGKFKNLTSYSTDSTSTKWCSLLTTREQNQRFRSRR